MEWKKDFFFFFAYHKSEGLYFDSIKEKRENG